MGLSCGILFIVFLPATMFAAQSIQLGLNDVVVAGGMESMSNAPKYLAEARLGSVSFIVYLLVYFVFQLVLLVVDQFGS